MSESGPTDPGLVPAAPDDQAGVIETIMQSIELAEQIPWPQDKQPIWTLPMVVTLRDRIIELEAEVVHNASDADITQGEKQ